MVAMRITLCRFKSRVGLGLQLGGGQVIPHVTNIFPDYGYMAEFDFGQGLTELNGTVGPWCKYVLY